MFNFVARHFSLNILMFSCQFVFVVPMSSVCLADVQDARHFSLNILMFSCQFVFVVPMSSVCLADVQDFWILLWILLVH